MKPVPNITHLANRVHFTQGPFVISVTVEGSSLSPICHFLPSALAEFHSVVIGSSYSIILVETKSQYHNEKQCHIHDEVMLKMMVTEIGKDSETDIASKNVN